MYHRNDNLAEFELREDCLLKMKARRNPDHRLIWRISVYTETIHVLSPLVKSGEKMLASLHIIAFLWPDHKSPAMFEVNRIHNELVAVWRLCGSAH